MPKSPMPPEPADRVRVPGEGVPAWVAILSAILGTAASVFVAQQVLPSDDEIRLAYRDLSERFIAQRRSGDVARPTPSATSAYGPSLADTPPAQEAASGVSVPAAAPERDPQFAGVPAGLATPPTETPAPELDSSTRPAARAAEPTSADAAGVDTSQGAESKEGDRPTSAESEIVAAPAASLSTASQPSVSPPSLAAEGATREAQGTGLHRGVDVVCLPVLEISFARHSTRPLAGGLDRASVTQLRERVEAHPGGTVVVEGHADAPGSEEYNLLLSYRRAVAVAQLLAAAGIARERIVPRAYGEEAAGHMPGDNPHDRRVVVRLEGMDGCLMGSHHAEMN